MRYSIWKDAIKLNSQPKDHLLGDDFDENFLASLFIGILGQNLLATGILFIKVLCQD